MFIRNLAAFTEAMGVEHAPTIVTLAQVPWPSDDDRNAFIQSLTGVNMMERGAFNG